MKIVATNLGGGTVSKATVSGINTKVTLAPSESGDPAITGDIPDKIASTNFAASSDGKMAIITIGDWCRKAGTLAESSRLMIILEFWIYAVKMSKFVPVLMYQFRNGNKI